MQHDRKIHISTAGSRKATRWAANELWLSELYTRLATPTRTPESYTAYMGYKKTRQDDIKDVGGYVGGTLRDGVRKAGSVVGRDIITLDMDAIPAGQAEDTLRRFAALQCGYAVHSTRKHSPAAPRLRLIVPTDRTMAPDEYEPVARKLAAIIDPQLLTIDRTTFEPSRLMYWPSCSVDSEYIYQYADAPLLSVDGMLALYSDWHDITQWPRPQGQEALPRPAGKQEDPETKRGVIGAFCRVYDVPAAMEAFLPGIYTPVDGTDDRYTYTGGSTTGGAVLYDGGKFLYSHHATDPAGGVLCNAYDLVRLHLHGALDDDAKAGTPTGRLPSYQAMRRLAIADPRVRELMDTEAYRDATEAFSDNSNVNFDNKTALINNKTAGVDNDNSVLDNKADAVDSALTTGKWLGKLVRDPNTGRYEPTIDNVALILSNDPLLAGRIRLNTFAARSATTGPFPWDDNPGTRVWTDNDDSGLRWYIERVYKITGRDRILDAVAIVAKANAFDPVREYLDGLTWDGTERLDTLLHDYLGAEDTPYTRAVMRKTLVAAVARTYYPGTKYDYMPILAGPQGIGKSTLIRVLGRDWFTDNIATMDGKEASEGILGFWLIEVGELSAMGRSEGNATKAFVSRTEDTFRHSYGRRTERHPRRCVFFGTTNSTEFLRGEGGDRRFWPVDVGVEKPQKSVFTDLLGEVDQIWAEAVAVFRRGEKLFLEDELAKAAERQQEAHRELSPREGMIRDFVERPVPLDWQSWDLPRRRIYLDGGLADAKGLPLAPRDRICAAEIWCELFGGDIRFMRRQETTEYNAVLDKMPGWQRTKNGIRFGYCGFQRGYLRDEKGDTKADTF